VLFASTHRLLVTHCGRPCGSCDAFPLTYRTRWEGDNTPSKSENKAQRGCRRIAFASKAKAKAGVTRCPPWPPTALRHRCAAAGATLRPARTDCRRADLTVSRKRHRGHGFEAQANHIDGVYSRGRRVVALGPGERRSASSVKRPCASPITGTAQGIRTTCQVGASVEDRGMATFDSARWWSWRGSARAAMRRR
jgi:hypothetical protein